MKFAETIPTPTLSRTTLFLSTKLTIKPQQNVSNDERRQNERRQGDKPILVSNHDKVPPPMYHVMPRKKTIHIHNPVPLPVSEDQWYGIKRPIFLERGRIKKRYTLKDGNENSWWRKSLPEYCQSPIYVTNDCGNEQRQPLQRWSYNFADERCYSYVDECSFGKKNSFQTLEQCLTSCWRPTH